MGNAKLVAERERTSQFAGVGCLVQAAGIVAPFVLGALFGVVGAVIGVGILVILFFVGSSMAKPWRCGNCKNLIASKSVRICPACKAELRT